MEKKKLHPPPLFRPLFYLQILPRDLDQEGVYVEDPASVARV